jgi:anti-sigma B factor antagonist
MAADCVTIQTIDDIVVATVTKEKLLDQATITTLHDELMAQLARHPRISLVVDLAEVGYLSSAMLGKFVALFKGVKAAKGRLAICGVKPGLKPLFSITKLDQLMDFLPDTDGAVARFRSQPL